jgi:deoxyribodipyrimidine photo-lyase
MTEDLRIHAGQEPGPRAGGDLVLYWMQATHRARHNFALDFAVEQANALRLPLLVYHGLRHDYPWASDRLHTFILESARDLYREFEERGIRYAFYLERSGEEVEARRAAGRPSPLVALARRAAIVVTDYFPTFIVPRQTRALRAIVETPVIAVDSSTVVPVRYHEREYPTAAGFRPRLMKALPDFLHVSLGPDPVVRRAIEVDFDEPLRPDARGPIPDLVASCEIDHTVSPAALFPGGPRAARARLAAFLDRGLARYAEDAADPNADARSRLSPYLHFGNISPHEVVLAAREAGPPEAAGRFLDEILTWRELAFNFCHFSPRHRRIEAVPAWAREELRRGESDPRPALYSDAELEEGRTGAPLWNAAQRAYLRDGWMHNTLRMLWGKAVLQWTRDASEALRVLEHLNNKYSLDGRDPSSYLNLLWVFGKFDRPFYRRPIYGTVRYLSLSAAAKKFDVAAYLRRYA